MTSGLPGKHRGKIQSIPSVPPDDNGKQPLAGGGIVGHSMVRLYLFSGLTVLLTGKRVDELTGKLVVSFMFLVFLFLTQ